MNVVLSAIIALLMVSIGAGLIFIFVSNGFYETKTCGGTPPDGNAANGYITGPVTYTPGAFHTAWAYDETADGTLPCAWKCDINHNRQGNHCIPA